jgi:hypothetical protein
LKEETRGTIETDLDDLLKTDLFSEIKWLEDEVPIQSLGDLGLGYIFGSFVLFAQSIITMTERRKATLEDYDEIKKMLKRRLPEILTKINQELNR